MERIVILSFICVNSVLFLMRFSLLLFYELHDTHCVYLLQLFFVNVLDGVSFGLHQVDEVHYFLLTKLQVLDFVV
jgi:hypothetical protein